MSANNYAECPKCAAMIKAENAMRERKLAEAYGAIPQKEYLELVRQYKQMPLAVPSQTSLREDWELGIRGNEFELWYSAICSVCGFKFTYKYTCEVQL